MAELTPMNSRTSSRIATASSRAPHRAYVLAIASTWSTNRSRGRVAHHEVHDHRVLGEPLGRGGPGESGRSRAAAR